MNAEIINSSVPLPRESENLFAHESTEQILLNALNSGRLPHAWIISGPLGIGKATLAYRFVRFIFAGDHFEEDPPSTLILSPENPQFRAVASGGHPDLLVIEPPWNEKDAQRDERIHIDKVRALNEFFSLTPSVGGWRIAIIDSADDMNHNAANAVLKILEEPPARCLILLISHIPGRLLATIRSRCQQLSLKLLPDEVVRKLLNTHFPELDIEECHALARLAEGSVGRAHDIEREGGLELYGEITTLLGTLPNYDMMALHRLVDQISHKGSGASFRIVSWLIDRWLTRAIRTYATGEDITDILPGDGSAAQRILSEAPLDRWIQVWEKINALTRKGKLANLDERQVIFNVFSSLARTAQGKRSTALTWV